MHAQLRRPHQLGHPGLLAPTVDLGAHCRAGYRLRNAFTLSQRPPSRTRVVTRAGQARQTEHEASLSEAANIPENFREYETMVVLRPTITEQEKQRELGRLENFLQSNGVVQLEQHQGGRQHMAYPMKRFEDGIYFLYTYWAPPHIIPEVRRLLSRVPADDEVHILRHMTSKR